MFSCLSLVLDPGLGEEGKRAYIEDTLSAIFPPVNPKSRQFLLSGG